jgi:uncharacterized OB-fold protein
MVERLPFRAGLFRESAAGGVLLGSKCKSCGQVFFPPNSLCTACLTQEMESVKLSREGTLYSFTTVHLPSYHFTPPYTIGWIELHKGVRVFSQLKGWERRTLKIGMKMRLVIEKLWDEDGKEMIGYKFEPV